MYTICENASPGSNHPDQDMLIAVTLVLIIETNLFEGNRFAAIP
jgi:hypothetical protein